jgi:hypothetical protein
MDNNDNIIEIDINQIGPIEDINLDVKEPKKRGRKSKAKPVKENLMLDEYDNFMMNDKPVKKQSCGRGKKSNPEDDDPEIIKQKVSLRWQITQYSVHFKDRLKEHNYKIPKLDGLTLEKLNTIKEEIHTILGIRNDLCNTLIKPTYLMSCNLLETYVAPILDMDMTGLSSCMRQNPELESLLREISIEYNWSSYVRPELRLLFVTLSTGYGIHVLNQRKSMMNMEMKKEPVNDKEVTDDLLKKYTDI